MTGDRQLAELLQFELQFLLDGGYGRSPHQPWRQPIVFLDSPTCLNFGETTRSYSCRDCPLMQFVPPAKRSETIPCHHIPLTPDGETLDTLYRRGSQQEIEEKVAHWLRQTLQSLEHHETPVEIAH
jgi:hypothetical protein